MTGRQDPPAAPPGPRAEVGALRAFVAVARLGAVGRAATALGRTQPSVSARIAALERVWSTRLFRRSPRGMTLTPEGARLLPRAEAALRGLEELDRLAGLPLAQEGEVRVGAGDALGRDLLPRALGRLLAERPVLGVRIVEGPGPRLVEALRGGEIDVALVVRPGDDVSRGLEWSPLLSSPVDLLLPPGEAVPPRALRPERLAGRRLVGLQPGSAFRRHVEQAFERRGLTFRPELEVGNLSLVRRFVAAGLGAAPVPRVAFRHRDPGPPVGRCPLSGVGPVRYEQAVRPGVPLPHPCRRLLELIQGGAKLVAKSNVSSDRRIT